VASDTRRHPLSVGPGVMGAMVPPVTAVAVVAHIGIGGAVVVPLDAAAVCRVATMRTPAGASRPEGGRCTAGSCEGWLRLLLLPVLPLLLLLLLLLGNKGRLLVLRRPGGPSAASPAASSAPAASSRSPVLLSTPHWQRALAGEPVEGCRRPMVAATCAATPAMPVLVGLQGIGWHA